MKKHPNLRRKNYRKRKRISAAQRRRMEQEVVKLQALAEAGRKLVEAWAPAGNLDEKEQTNLGAIGAMLFASYMSSASSLTSKRSAIAMALRAAYLYGRFHGEFPPKEEPTVAQET